MGFVLFTFVARQNNNRFPINLASSQSSLFIDRRRYLEVDGINYVKRQRIVGGD